MLEQRVQQGAVRIAAGVSHDVNLVVIRIDESEQFAIFVCLEIAYGFDVRQIIVVVQF